MTIPDLTPWQRTVLDRIMNAPKDATFRLVVGRRNGKTIAAKFEMLAVAASHGHAHRVGPGGVWCVTWTGIGPLWERLSGDG